MVKTGFSFPATSLSPMNLGQDQEELFPQYVEMTFKTTLSRGSFMRLGHEKQHVMNASLKIRRTLKPKSQ